MGITGKYDFPGIQKAGVAAIKAALATTAWGLALIASPVFRFFEPVEDAVVGQIINWLANKGLIVLNLGAIIVNGEVDQVLFDKALDDGLKLVEKGRDKISAKQGKAIDDEVIKAARRFIDFGAAPGVSVNADTGLQSGSNPTV